MPDNEDPIIQRLLRECRKQKLSYAEIGRMCGVTRSTAFSWFNHGASPTLHTVRRMSKALGFQLYIAKTN